MTLHEHGHAFLASSAQKISTWSHILGVHKKKFFFGGGGVLTRYPQFSQTIFFLFVIKSWGGTKMHQRPIETAKTFGNFLELDRDPSLPEVCAPNITYSHGHIWIYFNESLITSFGASNIWIFCTPLMYNTYTSSEGVAAFVKGYNLSQGFVLLKIGRRTFPNGKSTENFSQNKSNLGYTPSTEP